MPCCILFYFLKAALRGNKTGVVSNVEVNRNSSKEGVHQEFTLTTHSTTYFRCKEVVSRTASNCKNQVSGEKSKCHGENEKNQWPQRGKRIKDLV